MKSIIKKNISEGSITDSIIKRIYFNSLIILLFLKRIILSPFLLFKIDNSKIVISNYLGKGFGDNGKYIAKLIKDKYDVVWLVNDLEDETVPVGIRKVKYGSFNSYKEMSTARIWIDNVRKEQHPFKRKEQLYIQTWHGAISLKKIEKDVEKKLNPYYIHNAIKDSKMADVLLSNSRFSTEMYRRAFWFNKEILEIGSPRCDVLLNEKMLKKTKEKVFKELDLDEKKRIILYAPTFRDSKNMDVYNINYEQVLKKTKADNYIFLVRFHPNMEKHAKKIKIRGNVINVSEYPDMYELLAATDILITDYSSTMFEFGLTNRPVFIYATDIENYKEERDVYFEMDNLPFPISTNNDELIENIINFNKKSYISEMNKFYTSLDIYERGKASRALADYISEKINLNKVI